MQIEQNVSRTTLNALSLAPDIASSWYSAWSKKLYGVLASLSLPMLLPSIQALLRSSFFLKLLKESNFSFRTTDDIAFFMNFLFPNVVLLILFFVVSDELNNSGLALACSRYSSKDNKPFSSATLE